jgi:hypothetical protein
MCFRMLEAAFSGSHSTITRQVSPKSRSDYWSPKESVEHRGHLRGPRQLANADLVRCTSLFSGPSQRFGILRRTNDTTSRRP